MRSHTLGALILGTSWLMTSACAVAHDWYPFECCGDGDCAPAEIVVRGENGSYLITSRGISISVPADYPHWRKSPDNRVHVCIRKTASESQLLVCAFRGPGV